MNKFFSYLSPDYKVEKIDLRSTNLVDWFREKPWKQVSIVSGTVGEAANPEITIPVTNWHSLTITVHDNHYSLRLASELLFGISFKSIAATTSSATDLDKILQSAQAGDKESLISLLRPLAIDSSLSVKINTVTAIALFLMSLVVSFESYQGSQTYKPISSVQELQLLDVSLLHVNYQKGNRNRGSIFHLSTLEYPSTFYPSSGFPLELHNPESEVATIVNSDWSTQAQVHIPKSYQDSLGNAKSLIPIYSLKLNSKEYISPEFAVKVDVAFKDELLPFNAWFSACVGLFAALMIRHRAAGNFFGSL
ncbi:hypothetical protein [Pontibacter populi]|uniref:Uncharacterized protein n=1 Tax=Pontibacter populi TaxID=890055 RepID=A0ABV1RXI9_9BACT